MDGCDFISEHVMSALASIRNGDILIIKEIGDPHQYSPLVEMLVLLKIPAETPRTETIILLHRTSTASHFDVAHDRPARAPPSKSTQQTRPQMSSPPATPTHKRRQEHSPNSTGTSSTESIGDEDPDENNAEYHTHSPSPTAHGSPLNAPSPLQSIHGLDPRAHLLQSPAHTVATHAPPPYRPPLPPGLPPSRIPPWPALRTEAASPLPEVRRPIPEPFPPIPPNIRPGNSQRTSPGAPQRPAPRESPTSLPSLPPIHGHRPPSPRSPPLPGERPTPIPRLPPIYTRDPEYESRPTTGQPTPRSRRPPTPSSTPTEGSKQRSPDLIQRPFLNPSPSSTTLPSIHRGEPQNPRSPPNSGDQPPRMPSPPRIHVGDSEFESRVATAIAEETQQSPLPTTRLPPIPLPPNAEFMSKSQLKRWNQHLRKAQTAPDQTAATPTSPHEPSDDDRTSRPLSTKTWDSLTPTQQRHNRRTNSKDDHSA